MMTQKHLHELLSEDQEPFVLKNYIADRRCLLKKPSPRSTQIQITRQKPESLNLATKFCKNACLFASHQSPDVKKSPLTELQSPVKSSKTVFLHIPPHKAAILVDAAVRIHKQSSTRKTKTQSKNQGLGLFGSILKRFANRYRTQNCEIIGEGEDKVSVRDILKLDSPLRHRNSSSKSPIVRSEMGFSNGRSSGGFWSESNEEISMDLETSCSSHFGESEEFEFSSRLRNDFCESPFRFVLRNSPSSACRTPEFSSPATSPSRHKEKENMNYDVESLNNSKVEEDEEEDKEQCSPVSVLDPPFEDDEREDDGCDLDCSYAIVERAKQKLLCKLSRFERLAELDPVELDKRMHVLDEEDDDDDHNDNTDCEEEEEEEEETARDWFDEEDSGNSNMGVSQHLSKDMKRLISDIIAEEERDENVYENTDEVVRRACKRLESWEEVKTNTIDMMVEQDLRKESEKRKMDKVEVRETAMDVELAIFALLVEELATELDS